MSTPPSNDPVAAAHGLTSAVQAMAGELRRVNNRLDRGERYGRMNRHLIAATAFSILIDLVLTFFLVFTYSTAQDASQIAVAEHSSLLASCQAGNEQRTEQITLWDHLAALSHPPAGASKAEKAKDEQQIAALLQYIRHTFAPRDCAQVYATNSPVGKK